MKKLFITLSFLGILAFITQCNVTELTYKCYLDTSKTGYELAADFDDCLGLNAQIITAHVGSEDIEIRAEGFTEFGIFESNFAEINAEGKWVKPIHIFFEEDMSSYPDAPDTINGAFVNKMIAKDKIEASFLPDSDDDPALWVGKDPASLITHEGDDYFFEPYSLYIEYSDPDQIELLKGVKYCKLLSHQTILSWMVAKSFEDDPVLLTPAADVCDQPTSLEARGGSCIFYFSQATNYYCSDYTGPFFDFVTGAEKCEDRLDTSGSVLDPSYSTSPCSERTGEIEASIPGYVGLTGLCVIHCKEENEFIWNIYTENPASACTGFDFFLPE